jgi:membrane-associated phospholipid phosphatase
MARSLFQAVLLAAIMFGSLGLYLLVLKWRGPAAGLITWIPLDEVFPFRPAWVWAYLLPYALGPVLFMLLTPATFRWFVARGLVIVFVSLAVFIVLPTRTASRPPAPSPEEGLTARLYQQMVAIDEPPANAAPSLHVSLTCLLALALARDFPRWRAVAFLGAALVWLATLFTRQHHLLDVVTGVLLAVGVVAVWARLFPGRKRAAVLQTVENGVAECR